MTARPREIELAEETSKWCAALIRVPAHLVCEQMQAEGFNPARTTVAQYAQHKAAQALTVRECERALRGEVRS